MILWKLNSGITHLYITSMIIQQSKQQQTQEPDYITHGDCNRNFLASPWLEDSQTTRLHTSLRKSHLIFFAHQQNISRRMILLLAFPLRFYYNLLVLHAMSEPLWIRSDVLIILHYNARWFENSHLCP